MTVPGAGREAFAVDVDGLETTVAQLARCGSDLGSLVEDLERRLDGLRTTWEGQAATAQSLAQAEWERGFRAMQEALADMRLAARSAHEHYTGAVDTNVAMWRQVS